MAKFKVGDRARLIYTRSGQADQGDVVTIIRRENGVYHNGDAYEYVCDCGHGVGYFLAEQLEPIIKLGSWDEIEKTTGWKREADLVI